MVGNQLTNLTNDGKRIHNVDKVTIHVFCFLNSIGDIPVIL
jgi:hypothetical protein